MMLPRVPSRTLVWTLTPLAGLAALAVFAEHTPALALVNESASLPRGVYRLEPGRTASPGDIVAIDQPGSARAYLAGLGMPSEVRLLKRVAASGGDRVCRASGAVWTPRGAAVALARDRRGVALPAWRGCRMLEADELFLLGDTAASFDSRYFGPVRRSEVRGVYRETFRW